MAISFHPHPGDVLICDFDIGFVAPEMVKKRPVVVISNRRRRGAGIVTVVPLSTTIPSPVEDHHHRVDATTLPGKFGHHETWAKCDMVVSVALSRLDRLRVRHPDGKRMYVVGKLSAEDLVSIREKVGRLIGLTI